MADSARPPRSKWKKHENLAADIAQIPRERHEIEIDGEQHELDAHQEHDDVSCGSGIRPATAISRTRIPESVST